MEKLKKINPSLRIQTVEVFYSKKPENHWNQDNSDFQVFYYKILLLFVFLKKD